MIYVFLFLPHFQDRFEAVCVPRKCNANDECPDVEESKKYFLPGKCQQNGTCKYDQIFWIRIFR